MCVHSVEHVSLCVRQLNILLVYIYICLCGSNTCICMYLPFTHTLQYELKGKWHECYAMLLDSLEYVWESRHTLMMMIMICGCWSPSMKLGCCSVCLLTLCEPFFICVCVCDMILSYQSHVPCILYVLRNMHLNYYLIQVQDLAFGKLMLQANAFLHTYSAS